MGVQVTCDKCKKEVTDDFVRVVATFWSVGEIDPIEQSSYSGDEFFLCEPCYGDVWKGVE